MTAVAEKYTQFLALTSNKAAQASDEKEKKICK